MEPTIEYTITASVNDEQVYKYTTASSETAEMVIGNAEREVAKKVDELLEAENHEHEWEAVEDLRGRVKGYYCTGCDANKTEREIEEDRIELEEDMFRDREYEAGLEA